MRSKAQVTLVGNLGADPELRKTKGDEPMDVANLRLAVNRKVKDQEITDWYSVTFFGKLATKVGELLKKGDQIQVEGQGRFDKYTNKDNVEVTSFVVIGDTFDIVRSKDKGEDNAPASADAESFAAS
jgi:single-strand DNA-binding protein